MALPRDLFVEEIRKEALIRRDLYFLNCDLGAEALDRFRAELPDQFVHAGICEQNAIDVAAGLAQNGKLVYVYAMAPFITLRCLEQIKCALAAMRLPVTIVGVGTGYAYEPAGPTHYALEDIACMRAMDGIEILTPADDHSLIETARLSYRSPAFRYVRLDRVRLPDAHAPGARFIEDGIVEVRPGAGSCILACGNMLGVAREVAERSGAGVADVYRVKPIDGAVLARILARYERVVTIEEQFLDGGMGSAVLEAMADHGIVKPCLRLGVRGGYRVENGGRDVLHRLSGIDAASVARAVERFSRP
jgi:transketolase